MSKNSKAKRDAKKSRIKKLNDISSAVELREIASIPNIYFDESGNTGSNLLDENQPIFTLASCNFTEKDASKLLALVGSRSPNEVHFRNLKRRKSGQDAIVRVVSNKLINEKTVKVDVFMKEFMVTSKIVDVLIECQMHLNGEDLYLNGRNIAMSNMLYFCLPTFFDSTLVKAMYQSFVAMIRVQDKDSIDEFYTSVENVKNSSKDPKFNRNIDLILNTKPCIHDALNGTEKYSLDPSIPALFAHCVLWGDTYSKGFHVIHDDSQTIEKQQLLFAQFMDLTKKEVELGYDRRKFKLPLKGKSLNFASSTEHSQLQVSDIIASAFSYWAAGVMRGEKEDYLFLELDKLNMNKIIGKNKLWPTTEITPEELRTVHDGGVNVADVTAFFLGG